MRFLVNSDISIGLHNSGRVENQFPSVSSDGNGGYLASFIEKIVESPRQQKNGGWSAPLHLRK